MKELIIIGAGPAGLTASIYGMRSGLDLAVVERFAPGGQVVNTWEVENYPGFPEPVTGWDLMSKIEEQARRLGAEIINGDVESVSKENGIFKIAIAGGETLEAKAVIVTAGASLRTLGIPGEAEFTGRGVSYCATCDGAFFKDKKTVVIGGGNVALEEAVFLTRFAEKVYLVHRRDEFRADRIQVDRVLANEKIEPVYDSIPVKINGNGKIESVTLKNVKTGQETDLKTDGVFIFIGFDPNTGFLPKEIMNDLNEVNVDIEMRTPIEGLFAAGDIRASSIRQIVSAAGDAAVAASGAYYYITGL